MLRNLKLVPDEIEYLRLNKGGDVEIRFRSPTDEKIQTIRSTLSKKAEKPQSSENKKHSKKKLAK